MRVIAKKARHSTLCIRMAYAYDMQCSPQMNLGGARQYTRTPCPSVRFLADGGFENHILGPQSRQVHLPPRSSATCTIQNVGAFFVCATEASLKQPLTPYAAPLRPREPRAAGPTCQQKACEVQRSEGKHSRLPYLAQNVGRSCATL